MASSSRSVPVFSVSSTEAELCKELGKYLKNVAGAALADHGFFLFAISGGSMPRQLGVALSDEALFAGYDFSKWHVFYVDERYVALDSKDSNHNLCQGDLYSKVAGLSNVYPINPDLSLEDCAKEYEQRFLATFAKVKEGSEAAGAAGTSLRGSAASEASSAVSPVFDCMLLGMGPDGHCASLFPGRSREALDGIGADGKASIVFPVSDSPKPPPQRVTFSLSFINKSRYVAAVVLGENKADTLAQFLTASGAYSEGAESCGFPIALARQAGREGEAERLPAWFLDAPAASKLK